MPKGYWIVHINVRDATAYKAYQALTPAALAKFGGRMIVRGGAQEVREGHAHPRSVVVEFPSLQAARDCYDSRDYVAARALREASASADLIIVEGAPD